MKQLPHLPVKPSDLVAVFLFCLVSNALAQSNPPEAKKTVALGTETQKASDEELKQGSHRSLMLSRSQTVIQCMDIVREAFSRKDYLSAVPLMERILSEPNSFVPVDSVSEVAAHEEVRRLVAQMPADLRKRLDDQRSAAAQRQWEQIHASQRDDLVLFIRQYQDLAVCIDAWWSLGQSERDHGRRLIARSAFLKIADHPQASTQQRLMALIASYEIDPATSPLQDLNQARQRIAQFDPATELLISSTPLRLGQWLSDHPPLETPHQTDDAVNANPIQSRSRRPVALPIWNQTFPLAITANQAAQEQRQRELGVKLLPIQRPLIVGDHVIAKNLDAVYAYNLSTGANEWKRGNTEYRDLEALGIFERIANQNAVANWVQRRTQADSIFARMSTDGRQLYVIQEPDRMRESGFDRTSLRGGFRSGPRFNKLCAYSLTDGDPIWEIGGNLAESPASYRGNFFLGCPFVLDDQLFVLAQRETEVLLLSIKPDDGSLAWSLTLGDVLLPVTEDLQRSRVACPITWSDGQLLVSTGAGAVVAVDPVLRSLRWGYRYPARTISAGDLVQGPNPADVHQVQESWWDSWREPFLQSVTLSPTQRDAKEVSDSDKPAASALIFASPETNQIHALRLPDGEPMWCEPRSDGLLISGIVNQQIIVIEGEFARGHDLLTGRQIWRTATDEISGPPALDGSILVLPLLSGGTKLLDTRNGQIIADAVGSEGAFGSITETERGWVACNRQSVMLLPRLSDVRSQVNGELQTNSDNEAIRVRAAFLDLQAGDFDAARSRLEGLQSTPAQDLRRQALIDALKDLGNSRSTSDRSEFARQLKDLAQGADYRFAAAMAIASSALTVKDYPAAVEAALDGLSANLDQSEGLVKTESVTIRKDRVLLGLIDEAYRKANPNEHPALDQIFSNRLKDARKSKNRSAIKTLAQQLRGIDLGRQLIVNEDEKALRDLTPTEVELRLLDAAGSDDREIARLALMKLATRFERDRAFVDAAAIRERLRVEFLIAKNQRRPNTANGANQTVASVIRPEPVWPSETPRWESVDDRHFGVYSLVPIQAEPGSLAERLDIWLERNGNELLFRGESFFQSGVDENEERKLPLPNSTSPYRGQLGYMLRQGWGIGRIVILLVGSELFAITPLNDQGAPNSRLLWTTPVELGPPPGNSKVLKGYPMINNGFEFLVDQSNRQIGKVGPVRPGYFCYQKGGKLVAADTENGRVLWERFDLPADALILGDDHFVYLWPNDNNLQILSAIDGRKIEERPWKASRENLLHQRGSLVWTFTRGNEARVDMYDLRSSQLIWTRSEDKNSSAAILDPETLAIVSNNGKLQILEARTGIPICPPLSINAQSAERLYTWNDADRWYIAVNTPLDGPSPFKSSQWYESYRRTFVRGTFYCIDRFDPKILWQREMKDEQLALDQSRIAPVFVQLWKQLLPGNIPGSDYVMRVTDKRTGKLIPIKPKKADLQPYFLLNPDVQQAIVELRLAYETIRIQFSAESPVEAMEAIETRRDRKD